MLIAKEDSAIAIMLKLIIREYMWVKCAEIKSLKIPQKCEDFVLINALFLK